MTVLLLSAQTYDEWEEGAGYALVEVTPGTIKRLLDRISLASNISRTDSSLLSLEFWEHAEWIGHCEELEVLLEDRPLVVLDEWPECADDKVVRCECGTVRIYVDSVLWSASIKGTNILVESDPVTEEALRAMLDCTD